MSLNENGHYGSDLAKKLWLLISLNQHGCYRSENRVIFTPEEFSLLDVSIRRALTVAEVSEVLDKVIAEQEKVIAEQEKVIAELK